MDFSITTEEEALLLRLREHLQAGNMPHEDELTAELGDEVRQQLHGLAGKGLIVLRQLPGSTVYVEALTPLTESALANRRDVGDE
ncbi:hypothetical protein J7I98_21565 [Streptomyces sp. ISL-98]|uniref:hypothetical protein n=1 Tax=Streptomyces sp. ISL-98 TaxID=2819192 RepID=UPI001BE56BE0|nr:hypothetical protein [Streptomyces sp. ISL-98]MBT2508427.1 hypothetical protein [Streptomyces sp. ISL-98]